ncbi:uncharacterized protein LOC128892002 [Hylaeus anthracinus]|uniref:uncharacterized protein LOC128892002 n=1 Tax=Hylaeus anthracinus TaxID=313031 RepID=UPI0023B909C4|nr:uncharacterized protein LOC128892002 [Hylaeus anthracinus]
MLGRFVNDLAQAAAECDKCDSAVSQCVRSSAIGPFRADIFICAGSLTVTGRRCRLKPRTGRKVTQRNVNADAVGACACSRAGQDDSCFSPQATSALHLPTCLPACLPACLFTRSPACLLACLFAVSPLACLPAR